MDIPGLFALRLLFLLTLRRLLQPRLIIMHLNALHASLSLLPLHPLLDFFSLLFRHGGKLVLASSKLSKSLCRVRSSLQMKVVLLVGTWHSVYNIRETWWRLLGARCR